MLYSSYCTVVYNNTHIRLSIPFVMDKKKNTTPRRPKTKNTNSNRGRLGNCRLWADGTYQQAANAHDVLSGMMYVVPQRLLRAFPLLYRGMSVSQPPPVSPLLPPRKPLPIDPYPCSTPPDTTLSIKKQNERKHARIHTLTNTHKRCVSNKLTPWSPAGSMSINLFLCQHERSGIRCPRSPAPSPPYAYSQVENHADVMYYDPVIVHTPRGLLADRL